MCVGGLGTGLAERGGWVKFPSLSVHWTGSVWGQTVQLMWRLCSCKPCFRDEYVERVSGKCFYKEIRKRLFLNVSKISLFSLFCSVRFRMCFSCCTGKETKFLLFSDPERIFFIYFSLYFYKKKCRYLSGIKKKHTKAPVSLRFTALEENNFMKKKDKKMFNQIWIRDPCNHRGIWSRVPLVVCSCSSSVAMTASEKRCSNIVCTLPSWCTWGLYGNQNGITWLWRTIRANQWDNVERQKKQDKDQITYYASCHFYSCFAKNVSVCVCVFYVCLFS